MRGDSGFKGLATFVFSAFFSFYFLGIGSKRILNCKIEVLQDYLCVSHRGKCVCVC